MNPVEITEGDSPVILAAPHAGTWVPEPMRARLNATGRALADTDWHVDRLYRGLLPNATTVTATFHRYVIDANRDPTGHSLYPGQNTTGLVPRIDFDDQPIWTAGQAPDADEIAERLERFHQPYHAALAAQIERVKARHGIALLYDCHSIRSRVPFLFDGALPVFNIGTDRGRTCAPIFELIAARRCGAARTYDTVVNGRFRGGWTTRHYGLPADGVHAIQMELAQRAYLHTEAAPFAYAPNRAAPLRAVLSELLHALASAAKDLAR
ncbi:N-formylglutamate deformylase [uncultured Abyssibacter sp.]|uniref:N-formylglutamate deformylase n=1 Tax=uncultured Abyssibacter sp. TaxID=2320202 RepID=UPI0032B24B3D